MKIVLHSASQNPYVRERMKDLGLVRDAGGAPSLKYRPIVRAQLEVEDLQP